MKPMSLTAFLVAMLIFGVSLLWFPDMIDIVGAVMPIGTPAFLTDFIAFIPWGALSIILIMTVVRLLKRGNRDTIDRG